MNNFKKQIYLYLITLFLSSCGPVGDLLTNTKKQGGDEFLVEKKQPLTMPPNFNEIPKPMSEVTETINEDNETDTATLEKLFEDLSSDSSEGTEEVSGSLETSILEKIKLN